MHKGGPDLGQIGTACVENRILDDGPQIGQLAGSVFVGDVAPVDSVNFEQAQHHRHRNGPFVILQQVHIRGADAKRAGHGPLGFAAFRPETPQVGADECLLHG